LFLRKKWSSRAHNRIGIAGVAAVGYGAYKLLSGGNNEDETSKEKEKPSKFLVH